MTPLHCQFGRDLPLVVVMGNGVQGEGAETVSTRWAATPPRAPLRFQEGGCRARSREGVLAEISRQSTVGVWMSLH